MNNLLAQFDHIDFTARTTDGRLIEWNGWPIDGTVITDSLQDLLDAELDNWASESPEVFATIARIIVCGIDADGDVAEKLVWMPRTFEIRLYDDPYWAGLAWSINDPAGIDHGSGPAGPDHDDADADELEELLADDAKVAIEAMEDFGCVLDVDKSRRGEDGIQAVVTITQAGRGLVERAMRSLS